MRLPAGARLRPRDLHARGSRRAIRTTCSADEPAQTRQTTARPHRCGLGRTADEPADRPAHRSRRHHSCEQAACLMTDPRAQRPTPKARTHEMGCAMQSQVRVRRRVNVIDLPRVRQGSMHQPQGRGGPSCYSASPTAFRILAANSRASPSPKSSGSPQIEIALTCTDPPSAQASASSTACGAVRN